MGARLTRRRGREMTLRAVTGITPSSGVAGLGVAVALGGTGLDTVVGVKVGGVSATAVVAVTSVLVTAVTPLLPVGTYDVLVTFADGASGTLTNAWTVHL